MSHDRCSDREERFVGYNENGDEVYEITRYFKELGPEKHRVTRPRPKPKESPTEKPKKDQET